MTPETQAKLVHALRAIEKTLSKAAEQVHWETTEGGSAYTAGQLNGIRAQLATSDPTVGVLFPEIPGGMSAGEMAAIAGQLADYATPSADPESETPASSEGASRQPLILTLNVGDGVVFGPGGAGDLGEMICSSIGSAMDGLSDMCGDACEEDTGEDTEEDEKSTGCCG